MRALARHTDPDTSKDAADSVHTGYREEQIIDALRHHFQYGATTTAIADYLGLPAWSVSPRMRPLMRKNLVRDSGIRDVSASGRRCIVFEIVKSAAAWELRLLADVTQQ